MYFIYLKSAVSQQLAQVSKPLPVLLALSLQKPAVPAQVYRYILDFLASNPTPEQIRHLVEINYALPETLVLTLHCNVKTIHFHSYLYC
jgi:hypothetical protein